MASSGCSISKSDLLIPSFGAQSKKSARLVYITPFIEIVIGFCLCVLSIISESLKQGGVFFKLKSTHIFGFRRGKRLSMLARMPLDLTPTEPFIVLVFS